MNSLRAEIRIKGTMKKVVPGLGVVCSALLGLSGSANADCNWPPLNAIKQESSHTEEVRGVPFTSSYHSWQVPSYRIDNFHCSDSVDIHSYEWSLVINGESHSNKEFRGSSKSTRNAGTMAPLPQLPPLGQTPLPALPNIPPVAPVTSLSQLPALPPLG
jgi:hypothetical protein